jgi:hypothetical protein
VAGDDRSVTTRGELPPPLSTEITDGFVIGGASWMLGLVLWIAGPLWFAPFIFVVPTWNTIGALHAAMSGVVAVFVGFVAGRRGRSGLGLIAAGVALAATFFIPTVLAGNNSGSLHAIAPGPLPALLFLALASYWLGRGRGRRGSGISVWLVVATVGGWAIWGWVSLMSARGY